MSRTKNTTPQPSKSNHPEFVVRAATIAGFFSPPLASSTFHDLVNAGKITPFKHLRGFYHLNDSLRRLGLREVACPPADPSRPSLEDLTRLAFHIMDPVYFTCPSWLLTDEENFALEVADADHLNSIIVRHESYLASIPDPAMRLNYFQGAIDAALLLSRKNPPTEE